MNTDTGQILTPDQMAAMRKQFGLLPAGDARAALASYKEMQVPPTPAQMKRRPPRVGRNDSCPCGSGKKFKRCCYTGKSRFKAAKENET